MDYSNIVAVDLIGIKKVTGKEMTIMYHNQSGLSVTALDEESVKERMEKIRSWIPEYQEHFDDIRFRFWRVTHDEVSV